MKAGLQTRLFFMKYITAAFFIFIAAVIIMANTGTFPPFIKAMYDFPNGDKAGHFVLLSPDKQKVFAETFRVLRPGGKLAVSDIVTEGLLPASIKKSLSAWAGCVAGAVESADYIRMMEEAGFKNISVVPEFFNKETVDAALDEMKDAPELASIPREDVYKAVYSAKITAYKP